MAIENTSDLLVDSSPSKKFFLDMITKDVTVESSIMDLIDNAIDSLKRNKSEGVTYHINIILNLSDDFFSIEDDCGGMSKDIALHKAFKFGNAEMRSSNALGMYGIGMKRSIFKIGHDFIVESKCNEESYKVFMTRQEWLELDNEWKFHIEDTILDFKDGVHIRVDKLSDSLKSYLKIPKNIDGLKKKIASSYREHISKDVVITVNGETVAFCNEALFESSILHSYVKTYALGKLKIQVIAGVGVPSPNNAGWNIVCNGRTIIEKDRSALTGWESSYELNDDGSMDSNWESSDKQLPAFHNDFARFRGYVYLDSDDANNLPLNTTKDGLDMQHPAYEKLFFEMTTAMKSILPKLRKLQEVIRDNNLKEEVSITESFSSINLSDLKAKNNQPFELKLDEYKAESKLKSIPIYIEERELKKWKTYYNVPTNKELGKAILQDIKKRVSFDE